VSKWVDTRKNTQRESQCWKFSGHLESSKAGGEMSEVLEVVLQRVSSDLSIFVYVYIILIALLILLLSYYSTLIALIRVKTCLRIFNWYILVVHLIPLSIYVIWLFESFFTTSWYSTLFALIRLKINIKNAKPFFIFQTKYKIFLKIEWIINFSEKSKKNNNKMMFLWNNFQKS